MLKNIAVLGLNFGDEGKGHVVDYLCKQAMLDRPKYDQQKPVVVRFSGASQAAHQVVMPGDYRFVFSHFGSGTPRGIPTVWTKYCCVNPIQLINEYDALYGREGLIPLTSRYIMIDPKCPVTTPYEIASNRSWSEDNKQLGSCGVGICSTMNRECNNFHLLFEDLYNKTAFNMKMDMIRDYYYRWYLKEQPSELVLQNLFDSLGFFIQACEDITSLSKNIGMGTIDDFAWQARNYPIIFEGSQGLLLDRDIGFFPQVTPSYTGTRNILELGYTPDIWLVTRAYQTRHGAGPMSAIYPNKIRPNPYESNLDTGHQGEFRTTYLDLDLIRYAVSKDEYISRNECILVITCMDQMVDDYSLIEGGKVVRCSNEREFVIMIQNAVGTKKVYLSHSPYAEGITLFD